MPPETTLPILKSLIITTCDATEVTHVLEIRSWMNVLTMNKVNIAYDLLWDLAPDSGYPKHFVFSECLASHERKCLFICFKSANKILDTEQAFGYHS